MALSYPSLLPGLFADGAANHDSIPDTGAATGRMAWDVGFPPETSQPTAIGGVPPHRLDMNGLGNRLSQHTLWQQSGGMYMWDATLDYPPYAHVIGSDDKEYIAQAPSGPSQSSGAVNPVNDSSFVYWKSLPRIMLDMIYPVGSIYMSVNATNPATLFGGTWQQIKGKFILSSNTNFPAGSTGGNNMKQLQPSEMPQHTHTVTAAASTNTPTVTTASKNATATTGGQSQTHTHSVTFPKTTFSNATSETGNHTHTRGTMNIQASGFMGEAAGTTGDSFAKFKAQATGALYYAGSGKWGNDGGLDQDNYTGYFDASRNWTGATSSAGNHKHSVTIPATSMTVGNASANHTHSVTVTVPGQTVNVTNYTHTHGMTVGTAGGNASFSIMPEYFAVNVWQRTA
jgi:microcystin-dependent protein